MPGDTPLHIGVRIGTIKLITLFLEYHPNLCILNEVNENVLDIAMKRQSNEIVELIKKELWNQIYKYLLCRWLDTKVYRT